MITLTREEAQQVLDALERCYDVIDWPADGETPQDDAAKLLRDRLSAPEPEPVAGYRWEEGRIPPSVTFTAPPQREWQGLTDEDLSVCDEDGVILARYWEAKLREKNT